MSTLYRYLRDYWKLVAFALVLAAINQIFSMMDPLDSSAHHRPLRHEAYTITRVAQFIRGVATLLGAGVGVAFVSRVAKNFQDYFVNLITQQVGARSIPMASGIRLSSLTPISKTSAAAKPWANCKRFGPMSKS